MKRLLAFLCMCSSFALAQSCTPGGGVTCTTNLNLWILPFNYLNWNTPTNTNWGTIDAASVNWAKLNALSQTFTGAMIVSGGITATLTGNATSATTAVNLSGTQTQHFFYAAPSGSSGNALWRAIVAADIPTLNQNSTGSAALLGSTGTNGQFWGVSGGVQQWLNPTGTGTVNSGVAFAPTYYPGSAAAVSGATPFNGIGYYSTSAAPVAAVFGPGGWITSSTNTFSIKTQRGNDAVVDWVFDKTGTVNTANVTAMGNYLAALAANGAPGLKFPCGTYYFSSTITITGQSFIDLVGDNHASNGQIAGCVTFETDQNVPILWFDNTSAPLAGVRMEHIQFLDSSASHNQVTSAIRITDQENLKFNDVSGWHLRGKHYNSTSDTLAVTQGSTTVTSSGTPFSTNCGGVNTSNPAHYPCYIVVNDVGGTATPYPYEVSSCASTSVCTLAIQYIGATQAAAAYSLDYGGNLFWFDPGTSASNANQYGYVFDMNNQDVFNPVYLASSASSAIVNSRINFIGGWNNNAAGSQDGIFAYCGHFCDTMNFNMVAANGYPFPVVIADGHQNTVSLARFEQTAAPTVPTFGACSGSGFPCSKGVLVMSDNASDTYGNQVVSNYARQQGNAVEFYGISGQTPTQSRIGLNTFRTNTANCVGVFSVATNTFGECDGDSGLKSLVINSGTNVMFRCVGGTSDGLMVWKASICTGGAGTTTSTVITTP